MDKASVTLQYTKRTTHQAWHLDATHRPTLLLNVASAEVTISEVQKDRNT